MKTRSKAFVLLLCVAALGAGGAAGAAEKDELTLRALTGPKGGDVTITVPAASGGAAVESFEHVQVTLTPPEGADDPSTSVLNLKDVPADSGVANVVLGPLESGTHLEVQVHVREAKPPRTTILRGDTIVKLRPDLVVAAVDAPPQTLSTRPIDVVADIDELNGETGAKATLTLMLGPTPVADPKSITVPAGGSLTVAFEGVKLETAMSAELTVHVGGAAPFETDDSNNAASRTVEVTEHELVRANVLVPSLGGYGAQFNHHVYAPITPWPRDEEPGDDYTSFEAKAVALQPHIVRIFYNDNWEENKDNTHPEWLENYASFVRAVALAQEAGAIIDISFQTIVNARKTPAASMATFADVLEDLVVANGLTNVRWAEVGNELNSASNIPVPEYEGMVRTLDAQLALRGLDDQIRLMGPGLVENAGSAPRNHYEWSKALATSMGDVFDAWGEHVYWNYNDAGRLEYRLRDTQHLMSEELPPEQRKPVYLMEFGIRGLGACGTNPAKANTYYAADPTCPEIWRTRIAGFQQFWFAIGSAQLGFTGAAKWDAYWGVYDRTISPPQVYWTIGPPTEGSPLTPTYYALALLFHTTAPGWQVVQIKPWDESDWGVPTYGVEGHSSKDTPEKELAGYVGQNGELTVLGLDTHGRALDQVSLDPPAQYSIGGLPANTEFGLAIWNASGDGTNSIAGTVTTNSAGVARFQVPLQAAFALTTVPLS